MERRKAGKSKVVDGIPPLEDESEERPLVGIIDEENYENDCDVSFIVQQKFGFVV